MKCRRPTVTLRAATLQDGDRADDNTAALASAWCAELRTVAKVPQYRDGEGVAPRLCNMDECPLKGTTATRPRQWRKRQLEGGIMTGWPHPCYFQLQSMLW